MTVSQGEIQVTWPTAANSKSVTASGNATSEVITFSATAFAGVITLKADNDGTPASGDTVDFYLLLSAGDPDGASTEEYPNDDSDGMFLARLDTNADDPAIATVSIPIGYKAKLYAKNDGASAITVSACILEKKA